MQYTQSHKLYERACKVLAGGVSSEFRKFNQPHALFYSHGEGSRVWDVDGNEYLDFTLSQGPLILGHSHPHVLQRIEEYSRKAQLFAGQHLAELELAEKLQELIPCAELIRFSLSGSEANHAAFRVARGVTGRPKFIKFEGHYHGWFDNVAIGINGTAEQIGTRENPTPIAWSGGLSEHAFDDSIVVPWNDLELLEKVVSERHEEIAAIVTEPVMCDNGCIPPKPGFLEGLRELCDRFGIVLIFDEVITGFRLSLGGAQKYFGVTPDLAIFGKAMASGYPISVLAGKQEVMKFVSESKVIHAGTMNSCNPCVAAALGTIEVLEKDHTPEKITHLGKKLMAGLENINKKHGQNLLVQGLGPMFHLGFTDLEKVTDYRDVLSYDVAKYKKFAWNLQERGVRTIGRGIWYISNAHTEADINHALQVADDAIAGL